MLVYQRVNCFAPDRFDQWCQRKCSKSSSSTPGGSCFSDCPALVQIGCALFNNEKVRDHPNISQKDGTLPKLRDGCQKPCKYHCHGKYARPLFGITTIRLTHNLGVTKEQSLHSVLPSARWLAGTPLH